MIEELRRYRALAIALGLSVLVSVSAFVLFLQLDMERSRAHASATAFMAAENGQADTRRLFGLIRVLAENFVDLDASTATLRSWLEASDLLPLIRQVCERSQGTSRLLPIHAGQAADSATAGCSRNDRIARTIELPAQRPGEVFRLLMASQPKLPLPGGTPATVNPPSGYLAIEIGLSGSYFLRFELDPAALLDTYHADVTAQHVDRGEACLLVRLDTAFQPLACNTELLAVLPSIDAVEPALTVGSVHDFDLPGLRWRVIFRPSPQAVAATLSPTPFIAFAGTAVFCGFICWFVFRAVDRTVRLEHQNRQFADLLDILEGQNEDLDQFAVMAAHDLQAPLRFMVSNAHLLDMDIEELERPDLRALSATIIEQGGRMQAMILDLLAFCRAGQADLQPELLDVRQVIENEAERLLQGGNYRNARIVIGNLPETLSCDATVFRQIIWNLLDNALKFSQDENCPRVTVSARQASEWESCSFVIADNGCGIAEDCRERIFRPFSRLDSSRSGTGVGLAIVRKLVRSLRGSIRIESAVGGGTCVCFTLPNHTTELMS